MGSVSRAGLIAFLAGDQKDRAFVSVGKVSHRANLTSIIYRDRSCHVDVGIGGKKSSGRPWGSQVPTGMHEWIRSLWFLNFQPPVRLC